MNRDHAERGTTLIEILIVLAVMGLGLGAASLYLKPLEAPLRTGAELLEGTFRAARMKAMATTSAYRIVPSGSRATTASFANSCSDATWTADSALDLELPQNVTMTDTTWTVCFSSRGISNANVFVKLSHPDAGTRLVEVLLGGTTKVHP